MMSLYMCFMEDHIIISVEEEKKARIIDITGGYGQILIPLKLIVLKNKQEVIVGEDIYKFSEEDIDLFIGANEIFGSKEYFVKLVSGLLDKVKTMSQQVDIDKITMIDATGRMNNNDSKNTLISPSCYTEMHYQKDTIQLEWKCFMHSAAGAYLLNNQEPCNILHIEQYSMKLLGVKDRGREIDVDYHQINLDENSFEEILLKELDKELAFALTKTTVSLEGFQRYWIIQRVYHFQKMLIYQKIISGQDVRLYVNDVHPPIKLVIKYEAIRRAIDQRFEYVSKSLNELLEEIKQPIYLSFGVAKDPLLIKLINSFEDQINLMEMNLIDGVISNKDDPRNVVIKSKTKANVQIIEKGNRLPVSEVPEFLITNGGDRYQILPSTELCEKEVFKNKRLLKFQLIVTDKTAAFTVYRHVSKEVVPCFTSIFNQWRNNSGEFSRIGPRLLTGYILLNHASIIEEVSYEFRSL